MSENLSWPTHGKKFVIMIILNSFALNIYSLLLQLLTLDASIETISWLIPSTIILISFNNFVQFLLFIFILTWLDYFSSYCYNLDLKNVVEHVRKCQNYYKSLQYGIGTTTSTNEDPKVK